jgi:ABC-type multidrug transport system fused ATPase/permease subunit
MFADSTLIINIINAACIVFLLLLFIILTAATRMKGGAVWAAAIMIVVHIPTYLSYLARDMALNYFIWFIYSQVFLGLLLFPALWFFTKSQFNPSSRFTVRNLWHTIPAFVSLISSIIYYAPLTAEQIEAERVALVAGSENLPAIITDIFGFGQFVGYFVAIFFYVRKQKEYLQNNFSNSGLSNIRWMVRFIVVFFVLYLIGMIAYAINPRTDSWFCPIIVVLIMSYLVYIVIYYSPATYINSLPDIPLRNATLPAMDTKQMKEICDTVIQYFKTTHAYKNCDFTLAALAHETGIPNGKISAAKEHDFFTRKCDSSQ